MSHGVNKVIILGNLGADPESRLLESGSITNLSIATQDSYFDKDADEWKDRVQWHRVTLSGRLAEIASKYLKKGSKVYIEGRLRTSKWTDKQGIERYTTDIIARDLQLLDSKAVEKESW